MREINCWEQFINKVKESVEGKDKHYSAIVYEICDSLLQEIKDAILAIFQCRSRRVKRFNVLGLVHAQRCASLYANQVPANNICLHAAALEKNNVQKIAGYLKRKNRIPCNGCNSKFHDSLPCRNK